jgi:O-antigen ligase
MVFIIYTKRRKSDLYYKWGILWALKHLFNMDTLVHFSVNISQTVKFSIPSIVAKFFTIKINDQKKIFQIALIFSQYIILTSVPFLLGILDTKGGRTYDGLASFSGIFNGQHPLAITTSMASMFILYEYMSSKSKFSKFYNLILLVLAVIIVYKAFTRTGWVMMGLGFIVILYYKARNFKNVIMYLSFAGLIGLGGYQLFLKNNQRFSNRINDVVNDGTYQADRGSGRDIFRSVSLGLFLDGDVPTQIIGTGIEPLMDHMEDTIGMRLYSHNGFIDALVAEGIIGIIFMTCFIFAMVRYAYTKRRNNYFPITISCIAMWIIFQFVQGGSLTFQDLFLGLSLALISKDYII